MKNSITMHSTVSKCSNLTTNIDIAQKAGFDSLELARDKLYDYLDAGYTTRELRALTKDLNAHRGFGVFMQKSSHNL